MIQHRIYGAFRRQLAFEQRQARRHKFSCGFRLFPGKDAVESFEALRRFDPRQREMRPERPLFPCESECLKPPVDGLLQGDQSFHLPADAEPQDARPPGIGEHTQTLCLQIQGPGACGLAGDNLRYGADTGRRNCAEKFQRQVDAFRPDPAEGPLDIPSEHRLDIGDSAQNLRRGVEGQESPDGFRIRHLPVLPLR